MSDRSPKLLVEDILESAKKIQRYIDGMNFEQFTLDEKTIRVKSYPKISFGNNAIVRHIHSVVRC